MSQPSLRASTVYVLLSLTPFVILQAVLSASQQLGNIGWPLFMLASASNLFLLYPLLHLNQRRADVHNLYMEALDNQNSSYLLDQIHGAAQEAAALTYVRSDQEFIPTLRATHYGN